MQKITLENCIETMKNMTKNIKEDILSYDFIIDFDFSFLE